MELYTYFLIRSQLKNNCTTYISEKELEEKLQVSKRTIIKYIKDLSPYIDNIIKVKGNGEHFYNGYKFTLQTNDYSAGFPNLLEE